MPHPRAPRILAACLLIGFSPFRPNASGSVATKTRRATATPETSAEPSDGVWESSAVARTPSLRPDADRGAFRLNTPALSRNRNIRCLSALRIRNRMRRCLPRG